MTARSLVAPRLEYMGDAAAHRAQALAIEQARVTRNAPIGASGTVVTATFTAGQTLSLAHKLGRVPRAWVLLDVSGGYGSFQRTAWDSKTITIQSQNGCTAAWWVS